MGWDIILVKDNVIIVIYNVFKIVIGIHIVNNVEGIFTIDKLLIKIVFAKKAIFRKKMILYVYNVYPLVKNVHPHLIV